MRRGLLVLCLVLGMAVGAALTYIMVSTPMDDGNQGELRMGLKGFVNPLLDCGFSTSAGKETESLKNEVTKVIGQYRDSGGIELIGVFFDDLIRDSTFGIASDNHFIGASLMKIPVLIGVLKKSLLDPQLLKKQIFFPGPIHQTKKVVQTIAPFEPLTPNQSYSVEQLLTKAVIDSDNDAVNLLLATFSDIDVVRVSNELGVSVLKKNGEGWISIEKYTRFLRTLFNATYLDAERSQWALDLLTKSKFRAGLVAGVPDGTLVAHKFGERKDDGIDQFHDCGIIYTPQHPYILCVMTRGTNQKKQIEVIAEISKSVYKFVQTNH